ncbi:GMC family oxidoreductase [Caldimonas brevitalea]|uniref:GMC family oxidoreductase n=2 Tax=Caldimonas brevitalea TaxID=413882 RepID=A0A0G3BY25_9BURK|nr:GMC family oxidoreductase [Caldimonas brevitalea]
MGGEHAALPSRLTCDVAIVGTGAGGGITAELLARAGLEVVMIEEGPLKSSNDFRQRESDAYPALYQESAARKTADKAITILQGRCVGGSTTVNWTSSFRTPADTLQHWRERYALPELSPEGLSPWFTQVEQRLHIAAWDVPPNENNDVLKRGAERLGLSFGAIRRNVNGCWNLGSCGMGCPTNAKQSMLLTTVPAALDRQARLLVQTQARQFELAGGRVRALVCLPTRPDGSLEAARPTRVVARHYVLAGGAINSPALLLRSAAPDPHGRLGRRTFLHPVVISAALMPQPVQGWQGAPQTVYSDHFLHTQPLDGPIGYKLEAPPLHPVMFASTAPGYGATQAQLLAQFANTQALIALLRDGFHPDAAGGRVRLRDDGSPLLDYPLNDFLMDGARRALLSMAEIQFAAGARQVLPIHELARPYTSWAEARDAMAQLPMEPLKTRVVSAHVMGGCGLAGDERLGVVRPDGRHWQVDNLSVHDGSLFPTSIGANPQVSVYALAARLASGLAQRLTGKVASLTSPTA